MKILGTILLAGILVSGLYGQGDWPAYAYNQSAQRSCQGGVAAPSENGPVPKRRGGGGQSQVMFPNAF